MRYYLGIDNGGTTTKAAVFDSAGREVCAASVETKMLSAKPDFAERDMDEMFADNVRVIKSVVEKCGVEIAAVSLCGHGKGLYLWGHDGKPVRNGILSADNRAFAYPARWKNDGTAKKVYELSCQNILACQPVSLLAWLADNEPQTLEQIKYIFECKDYVRFRLTGEAFGEITDYSGANFVNLHTCKYDAELMSLFGLEKLLHALPPLRNSFDICGAITLQIAALTGLREGTPVAGGMFDIDACSIATGAMPETSRVCMIAGTWSINEYPAPKPILDGRVALNSIFCVPGYYLIEESSSTSAGNLEWFIKKILPEMKEKSEQSGKSVYDLIDDEVRAVPSEDFCSCPIFTPFLMGTNVHPNARASLVGMSAYHERGHVLRGVMEGVVFSHKYHYDKLCATRDAPPACVRLAGGAARSATWAQMFADVLDVPVEVVDINETGAAGAAMAAAVACGDFPDMNAAVEKMVRVGARFEPNAESVKAYSKRYAIYLRVINSLDGIWEELQKAGEC